MQKFVSERLTKQVPRSLINFLWYLFETYRKENENRFILRTDGDERQLNITICSANKTIVQDFGININTAIVIRTDGENYYMSEDD